MLVTAGMTAYYTFRMFFLCFNGEKRLPPEAGEHPHEAPRVMIAPLVVLALGAIVFAGFIGVGGIGGSLARDVLLPAARHGVLPALLRTQHDGAARARSRRSTLMMYISGAVALAGIGSGVGALRHGARRRTPTRPCWAALFNLWNAKYYVDEIYDRAFVRPLRGLGRVCFGTDSYGVDGIVWFVSAVPRGVGRSCASARTEPCRAMRSACWSASPSCCGCGGGSSRAVAGQ